MAQTKYEKKLALRKGDTVVINSGDDKGKKGKVLEISRSEEKIIVEGVNIVSKHVKPRKMGEPGGIIKAESALYADKVQLVCPKCGQPTRVGHVIEGDKKFRVCKKKDCGAKFE